MSFVRVIVVLGIFFIFQVAHMFNRVCFYFSIVMSLCIQIHDFIDIKHTKKKNVQKAVHDNDANYIVQKLLTD